MITNYNNIRIFILALTIILPKSGILDYSFIPLFLAFIYSNILEKRIVRIAFPLEIWLLAAIWLSLFIFSLISLLINGFVSEVIIGKPLRQIAILFLVYEILLNDSRPIYSVIFAIFIAALINAAVILLQYALNAAGISDSWLMIGGFNEEIGGVFRKPGLTSGYPVAGMLSLFGILSGLFILQINYKIVYVLGIAVTILALIVTSRMALYLGMVTLIFWLYIFRKNKFTRKAIYFTFSILLLFISFALSLDIVHHDTISVMFEVFINLSESSTISTGSSDSLFESLQILPEKLQTILFGNGETGRSDSGINIDSGYQITLFGGGVFYAIVFYILFFIYLIFSYLNSSNIRFKVYIFLIFILIAIAEIKGGTVFSRVVGDCAVLLTIGSIAHRRLSNDDIKKV